MPGKPAWTLLLPVAIGTCFGLGASFRGDSRTLEGVVVAVVPVTAMPSRVNRWCLRTAGQPRAQASMVAIVEFGSDARPIRYAFPQQSVEGLVAGAVVRSVIENCALRPMSAGRRGSVQQRASNAR